MKAKICIFIIFICIIISIVFIVAIRNHQIQVAREIPFNFQFDSYKGEQSSFSIHALLNRLIANSKIYKEEIESIPEVVYSKSSNENDISIHAKPDNSIDQEQYIESLVSMKNNIEENHIYKVSFEYSNVTNKISKIFIKY